MDEVVKSEECRRDVATVQRLGDGIPDIVGRIVRSCRRGEYFEHVSPVPLPSREEVVKLIHLTRRILFPGYFTQRPIDPVNVEYYLGQEITHLFESLSTQIVCSIRHDCFRYDHPCAQCLERGHETALYFLRALPELRAVLATDIQAAYEGDPASESFDEIIFSYPGVFAVTVYRMAHVLYEAGVPLLPRIMTEYAHSQTGIDLHPAAEIGESFFIDHGTGVVVGETSIIGNRVRLYQGVTLGALSVPHGARDRLKGQKRHPTIEDEVIIYSGATILGGDTVVGARSIIGGNIWLTESVPPDTKVLLKTPELVFIGQEKQR